jgi:MFS family permease
MGFGRFAYTPLLPPMMQALGLSAGQAGLIASANFAGYLAGALAAAAPGVARHARAWLLAGLVGSVATTAAMALTPDPLALAALRFLGGVASAFVLVFATAGVLDALAADAAPGLAGLHFAGVGVGIAGSAVLIWVLTGVGADWRGLWLACGAASALMALAAAAWLPREGSVSRAIEEEGLDGQTLRRLAPLFAGYGLFGFGYVITATFIVAMVRGSPDGGAIEPLVWLTVGAAGAPSVWLWLRLGAGFGLGRALALACAVEAIGVALSAVAPAGWGALAAAALLGATFMGITALGLALARELAPGRAAGAVAAMTAAFGLGQIIGPAVAGLWAERAGGFAGPSLAAAAALLIAAGLVLATPSAADRIRAGSR